MREMLSDISQYWITLVFAVLCGGTAPILYVVGLLPYCRLLTPTPPLCSVAFPSVSPLKELGPRPIIPVLTDLSLKC